VSNSLNLFSADVFLVGLDPPTLVSLAPLLRDLAYKSSPRLIMSLRPQDPIPDWITHLAVLGSNYTLALAGPKEDVIFAIHRWTNSYGRPSSDTAAKMAALMTRRHGHPFTDVGHTLSSDGVSEYATYSRIMSATNPSYIQSTGEMALEYLDPANQNVWRRAAEKPREEADLDDLLALTCLLPQDFTCQGELHPSAFKKSSVHKDLKQVNTQPPVNVPVQDVFSESLIELENVIVSYGSKIVLGHGIQPGFDTPGLNITIRRGTRLVILGPNGSGKTTFLSLLTSDHPQSYSLPITYFGRSRLPLPGQPGLSLWDIQSRIGHSSPEIHNFFPKGLTIRKTLESAWADTFVANPNLTDERKTLVDAFLRWWEPELNPVYHRPPPADLSPFTIDSLLSTSYPPFKRSAETANDLDWASSQENAFGALPFHSQRLLLFLRAIVKKPDIVILDEAFSGLSPEIREKAMLFLKAGERSVLRRHESVPDQRSGDEEDENLQLKSRWHKTANRKRDVEKICRTKGLATGDLVADRQGLSLDVRQKVEALMRTSMDQIAEMALHDNRPSGPIFTGLDPKQALIVVSHVRDEIPDMVNEYVRLPGEEEVSEQGRAVEMGSCGDGSLRTVKGWSRIWGLKT
jgi:ABC-type molybdenum transport system ATPase subunit/photorepair protein PhrA